MSVYPSVCQEVRNDLKENNHIQRINREYKYLQTSIEKFASLQNGDYLEVVEEEWLCCRTLASYEYQANSTTTWNHQASFF